MRLFLPLLFALTPAAQAGVAVREAHGRVDVAATAAPLSEVLDRLARQTGMKIVYEGPAPRQLVTLSIAGRSPAEAVTSILEGQGLNYALVLDATATRVEQLLVTSSSGGRSLSRSSPAPPPPRLHPMRPPPEDLVDDDAELEDDEDAPEPATGGNPATDKGQPQPPPPGPVPPGPVPPGAPGAPVGPTPPAAPPLVPLIPTPGYSSSPFNPKPQPIFPAPQPTPSPTPPPQETPP
jgi:hypothetical protein